MSPEERAKDLISLLRVDGSWGDWSDVELETLIASAIREAQASARNEALEGAARYVKSPALVTDNEDISEGFRLGLESAALSILTLKTKD